MITKYFTKVIIKFNPLGIEGKNARLFLTSIPPALKGICSIDSEVLDNSSKNKPIIKVTFKDNKIIEINPTCSNFMEISQIFDRHSRRLKIKESIQS